MTWLPLIFDTLPPPQELSLADNRFDASIPSSIEHVSPVTRHPFIIRIYHEVAHI